MAIPTTRPIVETENYELHAHRRRWTSIRDNLDLYVFVLPVVIYFVVFHYGPMYGVQIAFKDFQAVRGITGSPWVGLKHFERFFQTYLFWTVLRNTVVLALYQLIAGFPVPIILALLMNQLRNQKLKRTVQTVTYAPHFISLVVLVGMMGVLLAPRAGIVNQAIRSFGGETVFFMARSQYFRHLYVWSGVWQTAGWNSIVYLAALSAISPDLHEAAIVDGATKFQRILKIDLPSIMPTAIILLILNTGRVMRLGFEKAFLMQTALNLDVSEIIQTYVYKVGLLNAQFSLSAAVGLFNSVINLLLLLAVNRIARKVGQISLW